MTLHKGQGAGRQLPAPSPETSPAFRDPVLPQQNATLIVSCLAMPSMGSMVLRMDVRKGTMPNTARGGRVREAPPAPASPGLASTRHPPCPRERQTVPGPRAGEAPPTGSGMQVEAGQAVPTIGSREAGEGLHHEVVWQGPRLELAQQLLHHLADEPLPNSHQDVAGGLLPVTNQFLSPPPQNLH